MNDPSELVDLIEKRAWIPVAIIVVALMIRFLKSDTKIPINIPPRARIWAAYGLGIVSGVLEHVVAGRSWTAAIVGGLLTAALAVNVHDLAIGSLRGGKEIPIPGLMVPGATPSPGAPVTVPPPENDTPTPN